MIDMTPFELRYRALEFAHSRNPTGPVSDVLAEAEQIEEFLVAKMPTGPEVPAVLAEKQP